MAQLPRPRRSRHQLLCDAMHALKLAAEQEASLSAFVAGSVDSHASTCPPPPRLVLRGATEVVIVPRVWVRPKREVAEPPVAYAVYCKPAGSGVGVSLNNGACFSKMGAGLDFRFCLLQRFVSTPSYCSWLSQPHFSHGVFCSLSWWQTI